MLKESELESLKSTDDPSKRNNITNEQLKIMITEQVNSLKKTTEDLILLLQIEGLKSSDEYIQNRSMIRKLSKNEPFWKHVTRVKCKDLLFSAEWYRVKYINFTNKAKTFCSDYIPKGDGLIYSRKSFKKTTKDEMHAIFFAEEKYALVRCKIYITRKILRSISLFTDVHSSDRISGRQMKGKSFYK